MYNAGEIGIPQKVPSTFAACIKRLNPSSTNKKRSGESEHPCLKPLPAVKKGLAEPLIKTTNETVVKHAITHLVNSYEKPKCVRRILM